MRSRSRRNANEAALQAVQKAQALIEILERELLPEVIETKKVWSDLHMQTYLENKKAGRPQWLTDESDPALPLWQLQESIQNGLAEPGWHLGQLESAIRSRIEHLKKKIQLVIG